MIEPKMLEREQLLPPGEWEILPREFYSRDTVLVARELLGQVLVHHSPRGPAGGIIVETEAYLQGDPACHASRGMTPRNRVMFGPAGHAYIYFIYGMHYCFNIVTAAEGVGEAVLIRALEPLFGIELMQERRSRSDLRQLCRGPACLVQALGLDRSLNGVPVYEPPLLVYRGRRMAEGDIVVTTRIGIKEGADLPLRFYLRGNRYVSRP
ncbi:DNA-3-methyladenine glycosylase [Desulfurispora thermophila]|uniref:DNA-3-methyladenine glycosylase n=1 Tax=Desulfurispora thermophila TaxID=265470 RepID=UPI0003733EED|nr:DNA-3-methyladenine glycosylase [Desulfurispora thermophila]